MENENKKTLLHKIQNEAVEISWTRDKESGLDEFDTHITC